MLLNEGIIVATFATMGFTSLMKFLKDKIIKNEKIKYLIPNGFLLALIFGFISLFPLNHFNLLGDLTKTIWDFLGAYLIIVGLSGTGKIAGQKLLIFIKAFLSDKQTQVAQAELELENLKGQTSAKEDKLNFLKTKEQSE